MLKRFLAVLLMIALLVSLCAVQAEEEESGEAVLVGELIHQEGDDESTEFIQEPFDPYISARKPIGTDDRYSVNVKTYPYRAIAYIQAHYGCGCDSTGTGFLVGPSGLMTAGHVVYCTKHERPADRFTIYFGYSSSRNYLYKYTKPTTYWYNYSHNPYSEEFDYAYIKLQERVGDSMGWFGVSARSDSRLDAAVMYAAGYRQGELKADYDWIYVATPYELKHTIDTEPGYSGCPIFTDDYMAVAINVSHDRYLDYNYGCRITNWLVNSMRANGIFD